MIASLPMYDWPEIRPHTDAFWAGVARHAGLKGKLLREPDHKALWRNQSLVFSQTCGYPLTHEFKGLLTYLATPHYAVEGCQGPYYSSFIFAKVKAPIADFSDARMAINSLDSMSGCLALRHVLKDTSESRRDKVLTGSHVASLAAVQSGKVDICAIDAVVVALARRHRPKLLHGLHEVARSPLVPALPYVTRAGEKVKLQEALRSAFADPALQPAREALLLDGLTILPHGAYDAITSLEAEL